MERFVNQSITTKDFKEFFCEHFSYMQETLENVDWDMWFYGTGNYLIGCLCKIGGGGAGLRNEFTNDRTQSSLGMPAEELLPSFDDSLIVRSEELARMYVHPFSYSFFVLTILTN